MAEVEGSDGNQYNIPDFALEDTQEKMLGILKQQFKLSDQEVKTAQKALREEEKNSKAQLDAFKKLGGDLQKAMDGRGTLLGSMSDGLSATTGALKTVGGGLFKFGSVVAGVTTGLAALALHVTKGFGEDLRASGLVETGAAFGELGSQLNTLVPQIQSMGMSLDTTLGVIQDFRQTLTVVGTEATKNLVSEFNRLTASGSEYGRTLSENVEYLADEIDFRQRLMFMDQQDSALNARLTKEVLDSQVESAMLLGKSVKDIADNTKAMILGNKSLQSVLSSMPAEALTEIQKSLNTFSGIELPESFQASLMQAIADPVFLMSDEAKDLFNNIGMVNNQQSKILQKEMADMQAAVQSRDPKKIAAANKEFEKAVVNFAGSIEGEDQARLQMFADNGFTYIQDLLINQQLAAEGMKRFVDGVMVNVSNEARLSAMFDTQLKALQAALGSINTAIRSGFAPALENITGLMGDVSNPKSPLGEFNTRIGEIATALTTRLQEILGAGTSSDMQKKRQQAEANLIKATDEVAALKKREGETDKEFAVRKTEAETKQLHAINEVEMATIKYKEAVKSDQEAARSGLGMLGDLIEEFTTYIGDLVETFRNTEGTFMERLGTVFMDEVLRPLGSMLGDLIAKAWADFSFWDLMTGNSDYNTKEDAKKSMDKFKTKADERLAREDITQQVYDKQIANNRSYNAGQILDRAEDKDYDVNKTIRMLDDVGLGLKDLTGRQLASLFSNADELSKAVIATGSSQADFVVAAAKLSEEYTRLSGKAETLVGNDTPESIALAEASKGFLEATQKVIEIPSKVVDTATKVDETPGARPVTPSSTSVQTDPEGAEPTSPSPTSQDGTSTQKVKPAVTETAENIQDKTDRLIELASNQITKTEELTRVLKQVVTNTGATASNTG